MGADLLRKKKCPKGTDKRRHQDKIYREKKGGKCSRYGINRYEENCTGHNAKERERLGGGGWMERGRNK
jgi:hypothetical protein